jgi:hypothetical protein
MRTTNVIALVALLVLSVVPGVLAVDTGIGIGIDIETEDFPPRVWMCDSRSVFDDAVEPGRQTADGEELLERLNNYAFEGEQIQWDVLVMDKNGIEKIEDVFATIGDVQGEGNDIEVNCDFQNVATTVEQSCNARILEEELIGEDLSQVAGYWTCTLTVETSESMYGEYWITVEATDLDGLSGTMDENEYWFLNPVIALSIDGDLTFEEVRPGAMAYSSTLLVGNDADEGSGVLLDMFISGTDFYDSSSSGAMCPTSNQLVLGDGDSTCDVGPEFGGGDATTDPFCYFATSGSSSTLNDGRSDFEGYVGINYGASFNNPNPFYGTAATDPAGYEIIQDGHDDWDPAGGTTEYYTGNILAPGAEMAVTFRLALPEPCNGDFDTGQLFFWGEAI